MYLADVLDSVTAAESQGEIEVGNSNPLHFNLTISLTYIDYECINWELYISSINYLYILASDESGAFF